MEKQKREAEEAVSKWSEVRKTHLTISGFTEEKGPQLRSVGGLRQWEKARKQALLQSLQKTQACWHLDFSLRDLHPTFYLQSWKIINMCVVLRH